MFVETVTMPRDDWQTWTDRIRLLTEPPDALVAAIAWQDDDGSVTAVNVWDSADAVADFFVERVHAVVQAGGEPAAKPTRHGEPVAIYLRSSQTP